MVEEREAGGVHMKPRRANFIGCLTASSSPACHLFCFRVRPYTLDDGEAQTQESQTAEHLDSLPSDYLRRKAPGGSSVMPALIIAAVYLETTSSAIQWTG